MMCRAARLLLALWLVAVSTLTCAKSFWLIEAGRLSRVDSTTGSVILAPIDALVRDVAPIGNGGAWIRTDASLVMLDDALVAQVSVPMASDATAGPMAAGGDGGVWLGVGASLVNFDRTGSLVRQLSLDSRVLAIGVAGPDAVFVATTTAQLRLDSNGSTAARIDFAHLPGAGVTAVLMDPAAGYLWLVRTGAAIQFDVLMGLTPRTSLILPGPDAAGIDFQSGILTLVVNGEIRHYDRNAASIPQGAWASEVLVDIAGIEEDPRERLLWFGDRTGLGAVDLSDGVVWRVPGGEGVDRLVAELPRLEPRINADVAGTADTDASTLVSLRLKTFCGDIACVPSPAYLRALRLRATRDQVDISGLFDSNASHDEFVARISVAPWQVATPLQAWVTDAYGNRSNVAALTWPIRVANPRSRPLGAVPPTVAITAPLNNATYTAPLTTTIKAIATPGTGAVISKVDFYAGTTLIGTANGSPYNLAWTNVQPGAYALTAKVTDSLNATATSTVVNVTVNAGAMAKPLDAYLLNDAWAASGVVSDAAGQHNGTPTGAVTSVTSPASPPKLDTCKAASFAGGAIDVASLAVSTAAGAKTTVAFWMYWSGADGVMPIGWVSEGLILSGGSFGFSTQNNDVYGVASAGLASKWHHVVAEFTNGSVASNKLYLDGVPQTLAQRAGAPNIPKAVVAAALRIGGLTGSSAYRFSGQLDEVKIFNRALTAIEVSAEFAATNACATAPTISLTAPPNNANFVAPASIPMAATAAPTATGATLTKVEFYNGAVLLTTSITPPYVYTWPAVAIGNYPLTAKATDSKGATATSAVATVHVKANVPPAVSMTAPANNSSYTAPATINLAATASDTDGTVSKVEFYQGATRLATVTSAPYIYTWPNVAGGTYALTAKATDDRGALTTSGTVTVKVNKPPTVSITAPANNAVIVLPAMVTINANASDADGTISKVEFYRDGILLGTDTTSPYSFAWSTPPVGTYALTAKATDNLGAVTTSATVTISVKTNQPPTVSITSPANGAQVRAAGPVAITAIATDPDGTITKVDFYGDGVLVGTDTTSPYSYAWTITTAGVHDVIASATDNKGAVTWSAPVTMNVTLNQYPVVTLTAPVEGQYFIAPLGPPDIPLVATASDSDGTIAAVRFYKQAEGLVGDPAPVLLGTVNTPPYQMTWKSVPYTDPPFQGNVDGYFVWAEAIDNDGAVTASLNVTIQVLQTAPPSPYTPLVSLRSGGVTDETAVFNAPATIVLFGSTSAGPSVASKMEFIANGASIGTVSSVNNSNDLAFAWRNVQAGSYDIVAKLTDQNGFISMSDVFHVDVGTSGQPPTLVLQSPPSEQFLGLQLGAVPQNLVYAASLTDPAGTVTTVEVADNFRVSGSFTSPPYTGAVSSPGPGVNMITATALVGYREVARSAPAFVVIPWVARRPWAVMTSPLQGGSYSNNGLVTLTVDALSPDSPIARVTYYSGPVPLGVSTTPPYTISAGFNSGTQSVYALIEAPFTSGLSAPVTFTVGGAASGTSIKLTSPAEGQQFYAPASVPLAVALTDPNHIITKVDYFWSVNINGGLVATSTQAPWAATWSNVGVGQYLLTAVGYYAGGKVTSAPVTVDVIAPPPIVLTAPAAGSTYSTGQPVTMTAQAVTPGHPLSRIDFSADAVVVGSVPIPGGVTTAIVSYTWNGAASGVRALTATAVAIDGYKTTSTSVSIDIGDFAVALAEPFAGQTYLSPADIRITANPFETGTAIAQVDFYGDGSLLGSRAAPPFSFVWTGVAPGAHTVSAKARDTSGFSVSSAQVPVVVVAVATIAVDAGIDGSVLADDNASISGTVQAPLNSAIIVNGKGGALDRNGRFFVDNVLLQPGTNTITLQLNTLDGTPVSRTVTIGSSGTAPFQVTLDPQEGLAPLSATMTITNRGNVAFQRIEVDINDDGTQEQTLMSLPNNQAVLSLSFANPGVYKIRVKAFDAANNLIYSALRKIVARDPRDLAGMVGSIFAGMLDKLSAGNVTAALNAVTGGVQDKYRAIFTSLQPNLAAIVGQVGAIQRATVTAELAEIGIIRNGTNGPQTFQIYLIRSEDGIWRIDGM